MLLAEVQYGEVEHKTNGKRDMRRDIGWSGSQLRSPTDTQVEK